MKLISKTLVALVIAGASSVALANNHPTNVLINLEADANYRVLETGFKSSDAFDTGTYIENNNNGMASHTYNHGPKNITYSVEISNQYGQGVRAIDNQCSLLSFDTLSNSVKGTYTTRVDNSADMYIKISEKGELTCKFEQK